MSHQPPISSCKGHASVHVEVKAAVGMTGQRAGPWRTGRAFPATSTGNLRAADPIHSVSGARTGREHRARGLGGEDHGRTGLAASDFIRFAPAPDRHIEQIGGFGPRIDRLRCPRSGSLDPTHTWGWGTPGSGVIALNSLRTSLAYQLRRGREANVLRKTGWHIGMKQQPTNLLPAQTTPG